MTLWIMMHAHARSWTAPGPVDAVVGGSWAEYGLPRAELEDAVRIATRVAA